MESAGGGGEAAVGRGSPTPRRSPYDAQIEAQDKVIQAMIITQTALEREQSRLEQLQLRKAVDARAGAVPVPEQALEGERETRSHLKRSRVVTPPPLCGLCPPSAPLRCIVPVPLHPHHNKP